MNTNTNVTDTKPLTRKQKKWRRYRQYLKQKKLEKKLEDYFDDFDEDLFYDDNGLSRLVAQIYAERNSETHKQKIYDELDKFISETHPSDNIRQFDISDRDYCHGKKMYNEMKNDPNPSPKYEIFGSNGGGYTCFGLYKSKNKNIYIIKVIVQTPTDCVKIDDETIFDN
jgi:hypothetical protein